MVIKQKLAITMIVLFSVSQLMTPTIYAAIEKVENYAADICIQTYKGDWDGKDSISKKQKMNKNIMMI